MSKKKNRSMARKRFSIHKSGAKVRGIDFHLTFEEWDQWWLNNGIDKDYPYEPGRKSSRSQLCMCRIGDQGSYTLANIYCATQSENAKARHINKPNSTLNMNYSKPPVRYGKDHHYFGKTKSLSHLAKKVHTPYGIFGSRAEAAEHIKKDPSVINYRMRTNSREYYYV